MSITVVTAAMLLHEHRHRPITGKIVTVGRHSVEPTNDQLDAMLEQFGVPKRPAHRYDVDRETIGVPAERQRMSQENFFAAWTDAEVVSVDVSAYEGATIVHDMQEPLPARLSSMADFVYNGSCLDNIFDPAAAMRNTALMLKQGGRMYHFEQANSHPTAYLKFSADWFMDFCAVNRFADCKTYIVLYPNSLGVPLIGGVAGEHRSPQVVVYSWNPYVMHATGDDGYDCSSIEANHRYEVHCLSEKGTTATVENPIQKHYRAAGDDAVYRASAKRFLNSARPVFDWGPFDPALAPHITSSDFPEQIRPVAIVL